MSTIGSRLFRRFGRTLERALGQAATDFIGERLNPERHDERPGRRATGQIPRGEPAYPGDFFGVPVMTYSPAPDGQPDPGEIVWTWVPFEEDATRGKDRPVLIIGVDGPWLLCVALTSKDHDVDAAQEAAAGRDWVDIGAGSWDRRGRPSEVRINRILRIDPGTIRREGAVLERERFELVAVAIRQDARRQRA